MDTDFWLRIALHVQHVAGYEDAVLVLLNLSASLRKAIAQHYFAFDNPKLTDYFQRAFHSKSFIPYRYRSKFFPKEMILRYWAALIDDCDYGQVRNYILDKVFVVCKSCARERNLLDLIPRHLLVKANCDLEQIPEPESEPALVTNYLQENSSDEDIWK